MKISRRWLDQLIDIEDISTKDLADTLTNAGHEVESIEPLVIGSNLVIGYVQSCEPHPDSDHLSVCQVDIKEEILQIVCGAPNVAAGQKVIVAKVGAQLEGLTIKPTQIRGVESNGMICSLKELSLDEKFIPESSREGIEVLDDEAIVGDNPILYLGLDDEILDIKQTVNRSDFMSMDAIASEVAGLFKRELRIKDTDFDTEVGHDTDFRVDSKTDQCQLFWAKVINNVTIKESPMWIKRALRGSGMHPINNLVDISNLVMLETGQPNHFYDYRFFDKPEIVVIDDYQGTQVALDGEEYHLIQGDTIISSDGQPIGIGGVKGLGNSMIQPDTTSIVIEIASFDSVAIRETSRRLNLLSDASIRYSKPMDPLAPQKALKKILKYLIEYADVKLSDMHQTVKYDVTPKYEPHSVSVSMKEVNDLLGTNIEIEQVIDVFNRLNLNPYIIGDRISCQIPSTRRDLWIKEDLIEEVIRVLGYDLIESTYPHLELTQAAPYTHAQQVVRDLEQRAVSLNLNQVMTYTLVSMDKVKSSDPIELLSPLSENRQVIRDNLTTSLLETLQYNIDHKNLNRSYFEIAQVYTKETSNWHLGIIGSGELTSKNWQKQSITCDFYAIKGIVEELITSLGININRLSYEPLSDDQNYHPYQSAKVSLDKKVIGQCGVIHPALGIKEAFLAEINLEPIFSAKKSKTKSQPINKYPVVKRDLALFVPKDVTHEDLVKTIKKAGRPYLSDVTVFDIFMKEDQKSMAYSLSFVSKEKTLQDSEVNEAIENIMLALSKDHQAILRTS